MITNRNPRNYEVSIWTLQDSFITVLQPSNLEQKGCIEDPELKISDSNANTFSFKIPMHLKKNNKTIENPIWCNTQNGVIVENMRKFKVILNKGKLNKEKIFEFVITKIRQTHEGFKTYCEVESEELAFHELGKVGYKIDLSADLYNLEYNEWLDGGMVGEEPINNINYWTDKVLHDTLWGYEINMMWDGIPSSIVYEDSYVENWLVEENKLVPGSICGRTEKLRLVEEKESNRYNLIQTIAETFNVFCDFVYEYDENYYIINRKVVFFNNYIKEPDSVLNLTYYYDTENIERELDATELVSKMLVLANNNSNDLIDNSIANIEANPLLEDYLLNFDYLYKIGSITDDQYNYIKEYSSIIHDYNTQIKKYSNDIIFYEDVLLHARSELATAQQSLILDRECLQEEESYIAHLLKTTMPENSDIAGIQILKEVNYIMSDSNSGYYVTPRRQHAQAAGLVVYELVDNNYQVFSPTKYSVQLDETNIFISRILLKTTTVTNIIYIDYIYNPDLYHKIVRDQWIRKITKDATVVSKYQPIVDALYGDRDESGVLVGDNIGLIQTKKDEQAALIEEKSKEVSRFENIMGPALREGTWQPEDNYAKYAEHKTISLNFSTNINISHTQEEITLFWDEKPFAEEMKSYVEMGASLEKEYYPCIPLTPAQLEILAPYITNPITSSIETTTEGNITTTISSIKNFGFVFQDSTGLSNDDPTSNKLIKVDYGFINYNGSITPVIMLIDCFDYFYAQPSEGYYVDNAYVDYSYLAASNIYDFYKGSRGKLGYLNTKTVTIIDNSDPYAEVQTYLEIDIEPGGLDIENLEIIEGYDLVYPRIEVNSINFKATSDEYQLQYDKNQLVEYYDFYDIHDYSNKNLDIYEIDWENDDIGTYDYAHYLTIRPEFFFKQGHFTRTFDFNYALSNTGLMVYLDAVKILRENSVPKTSYTITPQILKTTLIETLYNLLHELVYINDYELKFENVTGYISDITLQLDSPQDDKIEVKNYKNKFEDLFSSIVASTTQIEKKGYALDAAAAAFSPVGTLSRELLQKTLSNNDLSYSFNNGNLIINDQRGIWAISDEGIVTMNGGGIFTANEKDAEGKWILNTGILPRGISANAITAGQLDTKLVRIYAGDDLRFQLNAEGLYAYKSWLDDYAQLDGTDQATLAEDKSIYNDRDPAQYVVHNAEGLFLIAEKQSTPVIDIIDYSDRLQMYLPKRDANNNFITITTLHDPLEDQVKRIEISWDGLILRNWSGEDTFYADANTGNLVIKGTLVSDGSYITIPKQILNNIYQRFPESGSAAIQPSEEISSFESYIIEALKQDYIQTEESLKKVLFLSPDVAAINADDYVVARSSGVALELLQEALAAEGAITAAITTAKNEFQNFYDNEYRPLINNISNIQIVESRPSNPVKYQTILINGVTEWYDGTNWVELESANINLGTTSSLNLIGATATFAATSKLNILSGSELNIYGSTVNISNGNPNDAQITNGITLTNDGLNIYSNRAITLGSMGTYDSGNKECIVGMQLDGNNGKFSVISNNQKNSQILFANLENDDLTTGMLLDHNGIQILSNSGINVQGGSIVLDAESALNAIGSEVWLGDSSEGSYIHIYNVNNESKLDINTTGSLRAVGSNEVLIATQPIEGSNSSSYVWLHNNRLDINTNGNFYINSEQFEIQSGNFTLNPNKFSFSDIFTITSVNNTFYSLVINDPNKNLDDEDYPPLLRLGTNVLASNPVVSEGETNAAVLDDDYTPSYSLSLGYVNFSEANIKQLKTLVGVPKTTELENGLPKFDIDDYSNGTLAVYYTDIVEEESVPAEEEEEEPQEPTISATITLDLPEGQQALFPAAGPDGFDRQQYGIGKIIQFISAKRTNIWGSPYSDPQNMAQSNYVRVGMAGTSNNISGGRWKITNLSATSGTIIALEFLYGEYITGSRWDTIYSYTGFRQPLTCGLYKIVEGGYKCIGSAEFNKKNETASVNSTLITINDYVNKNTNECVKGIVRIELTEAVNTNETIYFVISVPNSSAYVGSLAYIYKDITLSGGSSSGGGGGEGGDSQEPQYYYELYIKVANVWRPLVGNLPANP